MVDPPEPADDIVVTGTVDEAAKWDLLGGARALLAPSPHESFSLTRGRGPHRRRASAGQRECAGRPGSTASCRVAGMWFADYAGFEAALDLLTSDDAAPRTMARQRSSLRGGQLRLAGRPGPLLLVPRARRRLERRGGGAAEVGRVREGRAVAVAVGLLGEGPAARRPERCRQVPEGDHCHGHDLGRELEQLARAPSPPRTGKVVSVEPSPSACAASRRFCTAGKTEAGRDCSKVRRVSPHTTTSTGAAAMPPMAPWSTSRRKAGESRSSSSARAPPCHSRAVSSPMAARTAASRTTTKTKGWLFSALGAWVAAVRTRATVVVVDVVGQERAGGPLGVHHLEEVGHGEPMVPSRDVRCARAGCADWAPPRHPLPWALLGRASACRDGGPHWAEGDRRLTVADDAASIEEVLKGIIGQPTGTSKVVVERGPVQHFADAVLSTSPIYRSPEAARAAGFGDIPAPPTWPFAMEFSGQVRRASRPGPPRSRTPWAGPWGGSWPRGA